MSYGVPRECASDVDDERLAHLDLASMTDDDLTHELARAVVALAAVDRRDPDRAWLCARLEAVAAERAARRVRTRRHLRAAS